MVGNKLNNNRDRLADASGRGDEDARLEQLLADYGHVLFTHEPDDLTEEELRARVLRAMKATDGIRPSAPADHPPARKVSSFPSRAALTALAASLVLILGVWLLRHQKEIPSAYEAPIAQRLSGLSVNTLGVLLPADRHPATLVFRDAGAPDPGDPLLYDPQKPPVAYLFRNAATIALERSDSMPVNVLASCVALVSGDILTLIESPSAWIVYSEYVVRLAKEGQYQIMPRGEVFHLPGEALLEARPVPHPPLVIPPERLLGPVGIAKTEMKAPAPGAVMVLSPWGATYTQRPEIIWRGNETDLLELALVPVAPTINQNDNSEERAGGKIVRTCHARGGEVSWDTTGWPELPRGSSWQLILRHRDRELATTSFRILDPPSAARLEQKFEQIRRLLPTGPARNFGRASALLDHTESCAAEARTLAMYLRRDPREADNLNYMKLAQHAYGAMALPVGMRQMQELILKHLTSAREQWKENVP